MDFEDNFGYRAEWSRSGAKLEGWAGPEWHNDGRWGYSVWWNGVSITDSEKMGSNEAWMTMFWEFDILLNLVRKDRKITPDALKEAFRKELEPIPWTDRKKHIWGFIKGK